MPGPKINICTLIIINYVVNKIFSEQINDTSMFLWNRGRNNYYECHLKLRTTKNG